MRDDSFGDRMKRYERQYAGRLLDLVPAVARLDGRAFHTLTADLARPFDARFAAMMGRTTAFLVGETGARCGYTQSDEISLVWHEPKQGTMLPFDGKISKMTSLLASLATAFFNRILPEYLPDKAGEMPTFDCRVYSVPTRLEAVNYLIWREMDATRNSINSASHFAFGSAANYGTSSKQKQEMLFAQGINWNDYPVAFKRGVYYRKLKVSRPFTVAEIEGLPDKHHAKLNPDLVVERHEVSELELPPLKRVFNREAVILDCADIAYELKS
jgi:tRNA(His) guanylyltransferase